jgi:thiol-disulfide isomerase/thioredoxin
MLKKTLLILASVVVLLVAAGFTMYVRNAAPVVPPVSTVDIAQSAKPYVIKLHAQWCAVCMVTKDVWSRIEKTYSGRVHLVVLDFTTDANTEASRAEAARLGLQKFFAEYSGAAGTIVVLDGRTKEVTADINGSRDFALYRAAIDAALSNAAPPSSERR